MLLHRLIAAAIIGFVWAGGRMQARDGSRHVSAGTETALTAGLKECLRFREKEPGMRQWTYYVFDESQPCPPVTAREGWPGQISPEDGTDITTSYRAGPNGRETYVKTWWDYNYYLDLPASAGVTEKYKACTDLLTKPPNLGREAQSAECARTRSLPVCRFGDNDPFRPDCADFAKWNAIPNSPPSACRSKLEQYLDRQAVHAGPSNDFCWRRIETTTNLPFQSTTCGNFTYALMTGSETISVIEEIETARAITTVLVPLTSGAFNESPCDEQFEIWPEDYYCSSQMSSGWLSVCTQITDSWTSSKYITQPAARQIIRSCLGVLAEKEFKRPECYVQGHVSIFYVKDWDNLESDLCADEPDANRVISHYSSVHAPGQPIATNVIDFWNYKFDPKWRFNSTLSANTGYISADILFKTVQGTAGFVASVTDVWLPVPWSLLSTYRWKGATSRPFPLDKADLQWPYPRSARRAEGFELLNELEEHGTYVNRFMAALSAPPAFYSAYPEFEGCSLYLSDPPNGLSPGPKPGHPKVHGFGPDDGPQTAQPTVTMAGEHGQVTLPPALPVSRVTSGPAATTIGAPVAVGGSRDSASVDTGSGIAVGLANLPNAENMGGGGDILGPDGVIGANVAGEKADPSNPTADEADSAVAAAPAARASGRLPPPEAPGGRVEGGFYEVGNPTGGLTLVANKPIQLANGIVAIANDHDEVQLIDTGDRSFGVEIPLSALDVRTGGSGSKIPIVVATEKLESAFFSAASSKGVTEYRISTSTGLLDQAKEQSTVKPVSTSTKKNAGRTLHDYSRLLFGICGLTIARLL